MAFKSDTTKHNPINPIKLALFNLIPQKSIQKLGLALKSLYIYSL